MQHSRISLCALLLVVAACGTSPGSDALPPDGSATSDAAADASPSDVSPSDLPESDASISCAEAPGFPSEQPPIEFSGPDGAGAIPFGLIPLSDGVAIATDHDQNTLEPGGHIVLVEPHGVTLDSVLDSETGRSPRIAAIDDGILIASHEEGGSLHIQRRDAQMNLVWELSPFTNNAAARAVVGGPNPGVLYTFQSGELMRQSEFVGFGADGDLLPISSRPRFEDVRGADLAWNDDTVVGAVIVGRDGTSAQFWEFDGEPSALHTLSARQSNTDPAIVWTGTEWAVAYQESEAEGSAFEVFVAFVSADGSAVNDTFMVSEPGAHAVFPDIAAHPGGVTVVWQTQEQDGLAIRTIRPDRTMGPVLSVAEGGQTAGALLPRIVWTGERLVVASASYTPQQGYRGSVVFGELVCP